MLRRPVLTARGRPHGEGPDRPFSLARGRTLSKLPGGRCRCDYVSFTGSRLRRPGALITVLLAVDLAYRVLLRPPIRRVLGMTP